MGLALSVWKLKVCRCDADGGRVDLFAALVPDRDVRVSVKALALSCVGAAVALHPESFFSKLYRAPLDTVEFPGTFTLCVSFLMFVPGLEAVSSSDYFSFRAPSFLSESAASELCGSAPCAFGLLDALQVRRLVETQRRAIEVWECKS